MKVVLQENEEKAEEGPVLLQDSTEQDPQGSRGQGGTQELGGPARPVNDKSKKEHVCQALIETVYY